MVARNVLKICTSACQDKILVKRTFIQCCPDQATEKISILMLFYPTDRPTSTATYPIRMVSLHGAVVYSKFSLKNLILNFKCLLLGYFLGLQSHTTALGQVDGFFKSKYTLL